MNLKVSEIVSSTNLCSVKKEEEDRLIGLLTECFSQDPLYCKLIPESDMRKKILPEVFSCDLDELFETCHVYTDSDAFNGIIVVSDETEPYNPVKYYICEAFYALKVAAVLIRRDISLRTLHSFIKGKNYLNSAWTNELGAKRRLHIVYFAVRPTMQGKGVASHLMQSVMRYADEHGMTISLETHNRKNVSMYQHYGFHLFEIVQSHFNLKQFCMVR